MNSILKRFCSRLYHGYSIPIAVSLLIHAGLFTLLFISWGKSTHVKALPPLHIKASLVEVAKPKPQLRKVDNRAQIEAKKTRKAEETRRKKAQALARKKEIALKKKQETEKAERKRKELERQKERAEQLKREQDALVQQLAEEHAAREQAKQEAAQAEKDVTEITYYSDLIVRRMTLHWNRPPSARNDMESLIEVQLSPFGDLSGFKIIKSSGDDAFDRSVIQAIQLGTPVVELKELDRRIFEKSFRHFTFKFSPGDLIR